MKKYLSTLHQRPDAHKKRFAFITSGLVTLLIFSFWSMVYFGNDHSFDYQTERAQKEVSPLSSLKEGAAASFTGLSEAFSGIRYGLKEMVDLESDYAEMKSGVLEIYGQ